MHFFRCAAVRCALFLLLFAGLSFTPCKALSTPEPGTEPFDLPNAPSQQTSNANPAPQSSPGQAPATQPAQQPSGNGNATTQSKPATTKEEQQRLAQQQLKQEEKQRILGVVPNFSTTDIQDAAPLTAKQKFQLDLRSSLDPFEFVFAGLDAGEEQAEDTFPGYGQGAAGYAKRFGASYADTFDGGLWGNAILPVLLHEDPRYFRKGSGPFMNRFLYSAWTTIWCKRDNGNWGPNYANVAGNFVAGGISNLYYPQSDRGVELTLTRALTVTAEGAIGSEFVEFWPDISRHLFKRHFEKIQDQPPAQAPAPDANKPVQQTNGTTTPPIPPH